MNASIPSTEKGALLLVRGKIAIKCGWYHYSCSNGEGGMMDSAAKMVWGPPLKLGELLGI